MESVRECFGWFPYSDGRVSGWFVYAVPHVGTVRDIQNIHKILTIVGHRFDHQSGLYESSGQNSATMSNVSAFPVCLVF